MYQIKVSKKMIRAMFAVIANKQKTNNPETIEMPIESRMDKCNELTH